MNPYGGDFSFDDLRAGDKVHADGWQDPVDFLGNVSITGAPELKPEFLPDAIAGFAFDAAERMGVDPASVALAALVSSAAVISDDWQIQPKQHDDEWTEAPRIWGAIIGDPSTLKSPIIKAATKSIDQLEMEARKRHDGEMAQYRGEIAEWKKNKDEKEPRHPVLARYMVESLTVEALTEVLRDDYAATQKAPAKKVLVRSDELSELLANLDRYNSGRSGSDRGAFLRLFNGGRHTVDRIARGAFACPNWSACILGGIQPGPIQKIAKDAADDGMLQRFLFCVPGNQNAGVDRAPDRAALDRYGRLIPHLSAIRPPTHLYGAPRVVTFHPDAHPTRDALNDLMSALGAIPDTSDRMKAALGKYPGIYPRLCLLFHLIDAGDASAGGAQGAIPLVVSVATAKKVATYVRKCLLAHLCLADQVIFLTPQTGHARWLAGFILSREFSRVTRRDLTRAYAPLRAPECAQELTSVMAGLAAMGWLIEEETSNPARQPAAWIVNPNVHTQFDGQKEREARRKAQEEMTAKIRESFANG